MTALGSQDIPTRRLRYAVSRLRRAANPASGVVTAFHDGTVTLRSNRRIDGFHESLDNDGYVGVHTGDLVIHGLDLVHGAVGVSDADGQITPVCWVVEPRPGMDARFIAYALRTIAKAGYVRANAKGVRSAGADYRRWETLAEVPLPAPPLEYQRAVADFLQGECGRIAQLQGELNGAISLLRTGLVSRRSELLRGYPRETTVGRVTQCLDGRRVPLNAEERAGREGPYPYWGANSIQGYVDDFLFDERLVLLGEDGAPFFDDRRDVAWTVEGKVWVNNHAHVLRAIPGYTEPFLAEALNAVDYSLYITGATRDKLTQRNLSRIRIPAMSVAEQRRVVLELRELRTRLGAARDELGSLNHGLEEYRDSLISEAVTGQLDVTRLSDSQMDESLDAVRQGEPPEVLAR